MTTLFETAAEEQEPSSEEWSYKFIPSLARGVNVSDREELIEETELVNANNVRFEKNTVLIDFGYKTFGQVVRGSPRISFQFFLKTGSSTLTLLTNSTFYTWNTTALEWQFPSNGTKTTLTADANATDTTITVASISGFASGEYIGIALDSGKQHQTTINGAPSGSTITLTDAIPTIGTSGNAVVEAVLLTGTDDIPPSVTVWAAFDKMYIANGKDNVKEFDATDIVDVSNLPNSGNFQCRLVAVFNNYLIFMHTTEAGTTFPQRVRWGNAGLDNAFNESVNFKDLYDGEDFIVATEVLGTFQVIYKERSIYRMEFLGLTDQTWQFNKTIDAEGALTQDSIINLGDEHLFMGNSNIYRYDGGFSLDPIGDKIFDKIFAQDGELNPERTARVFGVYIEELDDAWWFYPSGNDDYPKNAVKLNVSTGAWSFRSFNINFVGFGFFQSTADVTWQNALGTWAAYEGPWISKQLLANAPTIHLLSQDQLRVYEYDYITAKDDGTAIAYTIETKDFYVPNRELRFDRYDLGLKGATVLVEASYDKGNSWETLGTESPGNVFARSRLFLQKIGKSIRFRFTGSNGFGLKSIGFRYKRESIWDA